jgi:hypothetical protein
MSTADCIMRSFLKYFQQIFSSIQTEKNKMGGACGIYEVEERCIQSFDEAT